MIKLIWLKTAEDDLIQIYRYIYQNSAYYAFKTINDILNLAENLTRLPQMGRKVPEYNLKEIRELIYKSYRVMYMFHENKILILRIWHGARLLSIH